MVRLLPDQRRVVGQASCGLRPDAGGRYADRLAKEQGKPVSYEFPSFGEFARFMAAMSADAQSQYIEWLLDAQDARLVGENDPFGWLEGRRPQASLARMMKLPSFMPRCNRSGTAGGRSKIRELLDAGKKAFVAVGQLHVMGPAGIPAQLTEMGVKLQPRA